MKITRVIYPFLTLLCLEVQLLRCEEKSVCTSTQYRALPVNLQNEHQCMVLERLEENFDKETQLLHDQYQNLYNMIHRFQDKMYRNIESLNNPGRSSSKAIPTLTDVPLVRDCHELHMNGIKRSGVYPVRLPNRNIINIWCDMDTDHGGWMLIQRRMDGSVNFTRKWDDYAFGFGNVNSEYWLGNENLYWLTNYKNFTVRFDLWDWDDNYVYAQYDYFKVTSEAMKYMLVISEYSGTAGDAMNPKHNNMKFSTIDRDYDSWYLNCAVRDQAGWWYNACGPSSLNGQYITNDGSDGLFRGITWYPWKRDSLKRTEIKIKPQMQVKLDQLQDELSTAQTTIDPMMGTTEAYDFTADVDDDVL